jgi:hypothetical protein
VGAEQLYAAVLAVKVNLNGTFNVTRLAIPYLKNSDAGGSVVTMKVTKQQIGGELIADGEEDQNLKVVGRGQQWSR